MLFALHSAATLYMTGLIWFVQLVHYPLMARIGAADFTRYELLHRHYTGWAVGPAMLLEATTGALLVLRFPHALEWKLGIALIAVIWLSTWLVQVPAHDVLSRGFSPATLHRLVTSNWIRTAAWTARAILITWMIATNSPN